MCLAASDDPFSCFSCMDNLWVKCECVADPHLLHCLFAAVFLLLSLACFFFVATLSTPSTVG